jgi:hypothetical protein
MLKSQKAAAAEFDARGPLGEVMKALDALNGRIDNIGASGILTYC